MSSESANASILLIDDSPIILELIGAALEEGGHRVTLASSGSEGLALYDASSFDIVITDLLMPDIDGTSVLIELRERDPDVIVIMLSSYSQIDTVLNAMRMGAFDYVIKDERSEPLLGAVQRAVAHLGLMRENRELMFELRQMNERLEQRVQDRTSQLERANRRLTIERGELERALRALNDTQGQLIHAEKMASIGVLTAGVAHEINNPLAFLLPNFTCLEESCQRLVQGDVRDRARVGEEIQELLGDCREGLHRIRDIVKELSFFSRRSDALERRVELGELVASVFKLLSNQMCHVTMEHDVDDVASLCADPGQLRQVLLNLLINAGHAIPEDRKGLIKVTAREVESRIEIRVADNGVGIPGTDFRKIFDPFYTTKPVGQGTGMGLAISRQLIERMKGEIRVESVCGQGTTMVLELPAWSEGQEPEVDDVVETKPRVLASAVARRAVVLLIDDEQALLNSMRRVLAKRYDVVGFRWGSEALAWLAKNRRPAVVLCDLMMPEMSGIELFERISRSDPELSERFVFITGGTVTREAREFVADCAAPVLKKPFELDEITDTIDAIIEAKAVESTAMTG